MLFSPSDLSVTLVDVPKTIRLVGVSYNGYGGGEMAQVTGGVLAGNTLFHSVEVFRMAGCDSFYEQLDALSSLPSDSRITLSAHGINMGIVEELTKSYTNTSIFMPRTLSRTERFTNEFALIIHWVATHSRPELSVEIMKLLEINPMGNWRLVDQTRDLSELIAIACANFAYEHGAGGIQ